MKKIILAISVIGSITLFGFNTAPKQYKVIKTGSVEGLESAMNTYGRMGYNEYTQTYANNGYILVIMSK